jgi:hypothetical protein
MHIELETLIRLLRDPYLVHLIGGKKIPVGGQRQRHGEA